MCPNGRCVNVDGSYKCVCNRGYRQSPNQQVCLGMYAEMLMQYNYISQQQNKESALGIFQKFYSVLFYLKKLRKLLQDCSFGT